ncbi:MAG: RNA polymerase sigma factor [Anaerolineales bacterium]
MTEPEAQQVAEWITGGAQGDEQACAALYRAFSPAVLRLALGLLGNSDDAEEVTQDTFVYALRNLARFDPARSAFTTWLFTIAISRCRNKRRRKWLQQLLPLETVEAEAQEQARRVVETLLERRGVRRQVWEALQELPAHLREAVALRYLGGLRYKEIGQALGCNPKTAESRVRVGLNGMRRALWARGVDVAEVWETLDVS